MYFVRKADCIKLIFIVYCVVQQVDDGILAYRPALEGVGSNIYYIGSKIEEFAYQAKVCLSVCLSVCVSLCVYILCVCVCVCE